MLADKQESRPGSRAGGRHVYTYAGACEAKDAGLRTAAPDIAVPLAEIFAEM